MAYNSQKDLKTYYSIGEVAEEFGVKETLLRFWEKEFPEQLHPKKGGRNVRQYTKADIEQVRIIHNLVKVRGLKLAAAREALQKNKSGEENKAKAIIALKAIKGELVAIMNEIDK